MSDPLILVIDDDTATHDAVRIAVADQSCTLIAARTTTNAFRLLNSRSPTMVVIDDRSVPSLGTLLDDLLAQAPLLRVVILVAGARPPEEIRKLVALGSVLVKPLDQGRLETLLRSLLRLHAMKNGVRAMRGKRSSATMSAVTPPGRTRSSEPSKR